LIYALARFLKSGGYDNVYTDNMPSEEALPEAVGLFCLEHTVAPENDGTGTFFVQIKVRRKNGEKAYNDCRSIFRTLDSGLDEMPIRFTDEKWCIARPQKGAVIVERTAETTTYGCEIALWGEN